MAAAGMIRAYPVGLATLLTTATLPLLFQRTLPTIYFSGGFT